jgi:single-stranded DNA-binding protein
LAAIAKSQKLLPFLRRLCLAVTQHSAHKAAALRKKGSKVRIQGRMIYPTWKDKETGKTRYGAEIVASTLDYQGANDEAELPVAAPVAKEMAAQLAEAVAAAEAPAKPKRRRAKKA